MLEQISAIAQNLRSLILQLHKIIRYFVEKFSENSQNTNTNKRTLLQRSCAAYAWSMIFNRKYVSLICQSNRGRDLRHGLWGSMFPRRVSTQTLKIFLKGSDARVTWPPKFWALKAIYCNTVRPKGTAFIFDKHVTKNNLRKFLDSRHGAKLDSQLR